MSQKLCTDDQESKELHCVMIIEASCLKIDRDVDCQPFICQLRHPNTDAAALFMFSDGFKRIYELLVFDEADHRSWFIDNSVVSDGRLVVTSQVDPLFLILPYLIKAAESGKFMSLEMLVDDAEFPDCRHLVSCCVGDDVSSITDTRHCDDGERVYRYNNDMTLAWLKLKVVEAVNALRQHDVKVTGSSAALTMFTHSQANHMTAAAASSDYVKYAHGLIADYLPPHLAKQLFISLGIKEETVVSKYAEDDLPASKKLKADDVKAPAPLEDYCQYGAISSTDCNKNTKLTAAQKQLSKVNKSGIKSISAFFSRASTTANKS